MIINQVDKFCVMYYFLKQIGQQDGLAKIDPTPKILLARSTTLLLNFFQAWLIIWLR